MPGEIRKAYQLMEEEAAAANNPSGHISKKQKLDAKDIESLKDTSDLPDNYKIGATQ